MSSPSPTEINTSYEEFTQHTIEIDEHMIEEMMSSIAKLDDCRNRLTEVNLLWNEKKHKINEFERVINGNEQLNRKWNELMVMAKLHGLKDHPFK
jgi:oligoendopeptidase F